MVKFRKYLLGFLVLGFLSARADSTNLPKEFFERADMFAKMNFIESLTIVEKISESDLKIAETKQDKTDAEGVAQ